MLFLVGNNKGNAHKKQKYTKKSVKMQMSFLWKNEQQKRKCRSFGKGTEKMKSVVPLEKEQQKHICRSFGKGNNKNEKCKSAIPFGKEQQIVKVQKCCSIWKGTTKRKSAKMVFH